MPEQIFALDVGTRTVVGIIVEKQENTFKIKASAVKEHEERSMFDGQIHDIPQVSRVVQHIKEKLEKKIGYELTEASVAAAGRSLKTAFGHAKKDINLLQAITGEQILALEIEAVQSAQYSLLELEKKPGEYHCVGYSVRKYWLDGSTIGNPVGQYGNHIETEVIATFLPRSVVDSLDAVLKKAGLKMASLTLEPIAAIQVAIPPSMRQLNLALVDIGAGTSDIAITSDGSITGYEMVSSAGDKVTEAICQFLLVDFPTGERIKKELADKKQISYRDAVGVEKKVDSEKVIAGIEGTLKELAYKISKKIQKINGSSPQAVICIGGGSLTPGLTFHIAQELNLPPERVAVRGRDVVTQVKGSTKKISGPQSITPLGIAVTSGNKETMGFWTVHVNNRAVRLLNVKKTTVADVLLAAGVSMRNIFGKPGKALSIEVNGKVTFIKGEAARPGRVLLNGEEVDLEVVVAPGDRLEVVAACDGANATATIADVVPEIHPKRIEVNGKKVFLQPEYFVNGKLVHPTEKLEDNSKVNCWIPETVREVLHYLNYNCEKKYDVLLNNATVELDAVVHDGDELTVIERTSKETTEEKGDSLSRGKTIMFFFNGQEIKMPGKPGKEIILADVLNYMDFNNLQNKNPSRFSKLYIEINGKEGAFTSQICEGDTILVEWR